MPSSRLGSIHGRMTSGVACPHRVWEAHTVERHRAWHDITALGQHTRSNDIERGIPSCLWAAHTVKRRRAWNEITALGQHTQSDNIGFGMPSLPIGNTDGRTMSGVACHHGSWIAHTVERHRAWHPIIALEWQIRLNDVGHVIPSSPLD